MKRPFWLALALATLFLGGVAYERFWRAPSEEELAALRRERRNLGDRLRRRLAEQMRPFEEGEAEVVVGVPAPFAERLAGQLATRLFSTVRLTVRDIKVRKEGAVRGKLLFGRRELGRYTLALDLDEARAVLAAGKPKLRFEGQKMVVVLPISLVGGSGRGRLRFHWDGRGMAGAVCGDVDVEGLVEGKVAPDTYTLRGSFALVAEGQGLRGRPAFSDVELRLRVEPSKETWQLLEGALAKQGAVCRAAIKAADVRERLRGLVGRGIRVKLPGRLLPPLRLPVELARSVVLEGREVQVQVSPAGLVLTPAQLWYATAVRLAEETTHPGDLPK